MLVSRYLVSYGIWYINICSIREKGRTGRSTSCCCCQLPLRERPRGVRGDVEEVRSEWDWGRIAGALRKLAAGLLLPLFRSGRKCIGEGLRWTGVP